MTEDILVPALIISGGALVSIILYLFLRNYSNKIIRMFQLYPESQDILKLSLRIISLFLCIVIFLVFLRKALAIIGLVFTTVLIESIILNSGKYFTAFLTILGGFYISRKINEKIKGTDTKFKPYFHVLSSLIVNTAFILTGLTIVGIDITVFLEVYRIILLILGITLSLIIGIPLGVYISNKINNKKRKAKKKH
ncbi:MAG: hypothetical protein Q8R04_07245 [Nanoarchaeota archaeon]|nr:hypothetical protein [Nanoarchaeota archaeon]